MIISMCTNNGTMNNVNASVSNGGKIDFYNMFESVDNYFANTARHSKRYVMA